MSERRVRLLYTTTCRSCGDDVPAGTAMWWDDDRRQTTCVGCHAARELRPEPAVASAGSAMVDERTQRRHQIIRSRPLRTPVRRTGGLGLRATLSDA